MVVSFINELGEALWEQLPAVFTFLVLFVLLAYAILIARQRRKIILQLKRKRQELQTQLHSLCQLDKSKHISQHQIYPHQTSPKQDSY